MSEIVFLIRGLDSLLFRDGRPFSNEPGAFSARTLPVPLPGTVAGFLRTRIGRRSSWDWKTDGPTKARQVEVLGPIVSLNGEPVFRPPADAVVYEADVAEGEKIRRTMCLRPRATPNDGSDTNIPDGILPMNVSADVKPLPGYDFWKWSDLSKWLLSPKGENFEVPEQVGGLPQEERVHVEISDEGTSEEGRLFSAQFLAFESHSWKQFKKEKEDAWSFLVKVKTDEANLAGAGQFGGENRTAVVQTISQDVWLDCPADLKKKLEKATLVRMVLATPAIFTDGWSPGWLKNSAAVPPALQGITFTLKGAAVPRREAVSGWDFEIDPKTKTQRGPKPVRWMAPAGSVFFFEVKEGDGKKLAKNAWLKPVSDDPQDQRDGYGLALWGIWDDQSGGTMS